jgi:hypothetical protein
MPSLACLIHRSRTQSVKFRWTNIVSVLHWIPATRSHGTDKMSALQFFGLRRSLQPCLETNRVAQVLTADGGLGGGTRR